MLPFYVRRVNMVYAGGGQNSTIRTAGLVLGMLVVLLRVGIDTLCYCVHMSGLECEKTLIETHSSACILSSHDVAYFT